MLRTATVVALSLAAAVLTQPASSARPALSSPSRAVTSRCPQVRRRPRWRTASSSSSRPAPRSPRSAPTSRTWSTERWRARRCPAARSPCARARSPRPRPPRWPARSRPAPTSSGPRPTPWPTPTTPATCSRPPASTTRSTRPSSTSGTPATRRTPRWPRPARPRGPRRLRHQGPALWPATRGNPGLVLAVVDTGVRPTHPDLSVDLVPGYDMIATPATSNDGDGRDADASDPGDFVTDGDPCGVGAPARNSTWHGTHVSGTAAAPADNALGVAGVAPAVKIQPVRVLGKCGGYISDIATGHPVGRRCAGARPARQPHARQGDQHVARRRRRLWRRLPVRDRRRPRPGRDDRGVRRQRQLRREQQASGQLQRRRRGRRPPRVRRPRLLLQLRGHRRRLRARWRDRRG